MSRHQPNLRHARSAKLQSPVPSAQVSPQTPFSYSYAQNWAIKIENDLFLPTEIASDGLRGRVFEVSLGDLNENEESFRKFKLIVEEIQGKTCLTNFHGMDITTDKLRSMIKKKQVNNTSTHTHTGQSILSVWLKSFSPIEHHWGLRWHQDHRWICVENFLHRVHQESTRLETRDRLCPAHQSKQTRVLLIYTRILPLLLIGVPWQFKIQSIDHVSE